MLLMIDNYDSFTFNLVQYFAELGEDVRVFRNDEITLEGIAELRPGRLVLSPGPCSPAEAGICVASIGHFMGKLPILGVCLGHQSIGAALGGNIIRSKVQMHGKASEISTDERGVFSGLPAKFTVIRYHSWPSSARRSPMCCRSPPPPRMAKSWAFVTANWLALRRRSRACSSIPNPSSPSTVTPC